MLVHFPPPIIPQSSSHWLIPAIHPPSTPSFLLLGVALLVFFSLFSPRRRRGSLSPHALAPPVLPFPSGPPHSFPGIGFTPLADFRPFLRPATNPPRPSDLALFRLFGVSLHAPLPPWPWAVVEDGQQKIIVMNHIGLLLTVASNSSFAVLPFHFTNKQRLVISWASSTILRLLLEIQWTPYLTSWQEGAPFSPAMTPLRCLPPSWTS
jgi:hypothetical protein